MKRLLLLMFSVIFCFVTKAEDTDISTIDNTIYIENFSAKAGDQVEVSVKMKNNFAPTGFQFDVVLPKGVSVAMDDDFYLIDLSTARTTARKTDTFSSDKRSDGSIRVLCSSTKNYTFSGYDGEVAVMTLDIDADLDSGEYPIILKNVELSEADGTAHPVSGTINSTVKIQGTPKNYTIEVTSSDAGKGTVTGGGTYLGGTTVTLTATPKTGYEFAGWSDGATDNPYSFTAAGNVSLSANFNARQYNLAYKVDGVEYMSFPTEYGTSITPIDAPTKEGYTFSGWSTVPSTMPASDVEITGSFTINTYNLKYVVDGETYKTIPATYGAAITPETNPAKEGYTFSGWSEIPSTMPADDVTVTGSFTVNSYTITFDTDGADDIPAITQDYGTAVTKPADPTKTGYTFTGWDKTVPATMPAGDMTIKALWTINQYTISFDTDGGSEIASITQNYGTAVTAPAVPTKTGYTFTGWDKEIPSTMPAENVTVKALWTVNKYNVNFVVDGVAVYDETMDYGATITAPENPEKEGYTFTGWSPEVAATVPTSDVTYTAQFTINSYDLKYVVDGETYKTVTATYGAAITPETNPAKEGYTFSGWSEIPSTMPANDVTVTGSFTVNSYTITFDTDGADDIPAITQDYGTAVTKPADPTKTGYTFTGWDKTVPATMPAGDMTIKALWTVNQYTITFNTDGGSAIDPITGDYGSSVTAPAEPTKTGYTFTGWDKEIPSTLMEDITVTAQWQINKYKVTFIADGATLKEDELDYGSPITAPAAPEKEGYTFSGWDPSVAETVPANDVTYTAKFMLQPYYLIYMVDGEEYQRVSFEFGSQTSVLDAPVKEGYTFSGWSEIPSTMPANDVTVTGSFTVNSYTITFDTDGGNEILAVTQNYGTTVTKPANPTKTGYTFTGWDKTVPATMPAGDLTIKALWTVNQYTITFDTDGGSAIETIKQDYGTAVTKPSDPTKTGYTFTGWDKEIPSTMPAENVDVKALWSVNKYNVKFVIDGVAVYDEVLDFGTEITAPEVPSKEGYVFAGWDPEVDKTVQAKDVEYTAKYMLQPYYLVYVVDGKEYQRVAFEYGSKTTVLDAPVKEGYTFSGWSEIPSTMPANDVTVTGSFTVNSYTITFDTDGGNEIPAVTQNYGTTVTKPANPTKTGYTFTGWDKAVPPTMPAGDMTIKALWTINQYTISFDTDGGSEIAAIKQNYGTAVTKPSDPTKTGYTFNGWDKEIPSTMPAENISVKALWTVNEYHVYAEVDGKQVDLGEMKYGEEIKLPEVPAREGYTWVWDKNNPTIVGAYAITLKGEYVANKYTVTYMLDGKVVGTKEVAFGESIPSFEYTPENPDITISRWYSDAEYTTMPAKDIVYNADFTNGIRNVDINSKVDVYTTNGTKLKSNVTLNEIKRLLPVGVYIVNGQKMVIK